MIHLFIGTKAQFVKMAPIMVELRRRGMSFRYVDSGQHAGRTRSLRRSFDLPEPDVLLRAAGDDIASVGAAAAWFVRLAGRAWADRAWLRREVFPGGGVCLIHGDTLSTLLGLQMARWAGLRVAHVEAGLRSFRMFDPFPEEWIRIYCMRRADLLFAPSSEAAENLRRMRVRGRVVAVGGNTVADALRLMRGAPPPGSVPAGPFALATCHRTETLARREHLARVVALINRVACEMPVVFVMHEPTRKALARFGLDGRLAPGVRRLGLLDYPEFVGMLRSARVVLTDGGSIQEECAYLGKPCLVLRSATERPDGLGRNAVLWGFDDEAAESFLARADDLASPGVDLPRASGRIVDTLGELGEASEPEKTRGEQA